MKKLLVLILSILIIFANVNVACAVYYSPAEDFNITEDGAISYKGNDARVVIPKEINGIKVTALDYYAFYGNENVVEVVIPDTVTHIYMGAFYYCSKLENIEIPMSIEYLDKEILDYSKIMNDFEASGKDGYLQVGSCIFASKYTSEYDVETKIKIGDDVSAIAPRAFAMWKRASFDIGKNVKYIGSGAFENTLITGDKIIDNVVYSGKYAIYSCANEEGGSTRKYSENVEIKQGTEILAEGLFGNYDYQNHTIKSVKLPRSITKISDYAFAHTWNLESIEWNEDIEKIGKHAFYQTNLGELVLPYNLKEIGRSAFEYANLTKLYIFDQLESIDNYAFGNNRNLTDIYYTGTEKQWDAIKKTNPGFPSNVNIHYNCNPADFYESKLPENINEVTLVGGGTAYGRFFVRDLRGVPARDCGVGYKIDGKDAKYTFTDSEGFLKIAVENISESKDYNIEIFSMVTPVINETLKVTVLPATFKSSYEAIVTKGLEAGLSAGVGVKLGPAEFKAALGEVGVGGSVAQSLAFEQEYKDGKSKVSLTTKMDANALGKAKIGIFADINLAKGLMLEGTVVEAGGEASIGVLAGATLSIEDFDIAKEENVQEVGKMLLASILQANGSNVISRELLGKLDVKAESFEIGNNVALNGAVGFGIVGSKGEENIADAEVVLYGVDGKAVWENTTTYNPDGEVKYKSSFVKGSGEKVLDMELKTGGEGQLAGGSAFITTGKSKDNVSLEAVHNENKHLKSLAFTAKETEDDGYLWNVETTQTGYTVRYPFETATGVSVLNTHLSAFSRGDMALLSTSQWQEISDVMLNNQARGEYATTLATQKGINIDLGISGEAGVKLAGEFGVSGVETLEYDAESGFIENGEIFIQSSNYIYNDLKNRITLDDIADVSKTIVEGLIEELLETTTEVVEEKVEVLGATLKPIGNSIKGKVATITTPKKMIETRAILLLSGEDDEFSTSSAVTTIGNPYIIEIKDGEELLEEFGESELVLTYTDDMAQSIDEECISVAKWDEEKCVYIAIESVVDTKNNKVSVKIKKPGEYILSTDTLPPAITELKINKDDSFEPEIFAVVTDVSGIADFGLKINGEEHVNINSFGEYYDCSTGFFSFPVKNLEEGFYDVEIYVKDSKGNETTTYTGFSVSKNVVVPDLVEIPENLVNGDEITAEGEQLWSARRVYLCAEAVDENGKKYSKSIPMTLAEDEQGKCIYRAKIEGIPGGLEADVWCKIYGYNGNCFETDKVRKKMAMPEIIIKEVLKGYVEIVCTNPAGLVDKGRIYATVYDSEGVMIGIQTTVPEEEIVFTQLPEGATVKAFLWQGVKPLCEKSVVIKE